MSVSKNVNFELPLNADGSPNPNYIDLLDEDKPIADQKFVCVSFVSPEKIIKDKQQFFFEKFLGVWDFTKSAEKFRQFMHFLSVKYSLNFDNMNKDYEEFIEEEKSFLKENTIEADFKTFVDNNEEVLQKEFDQAHEFQTSVRSVKIRGVFPTQQEAELRCKMLREVDPNHDVYVGPVGLWMPWEPEAYKTGRVEYLEPELNKLMSEKQKNDAKAKQEFENRIKEAKQKAIEENIQKAKESGNKLTQNVDEEGNLYNIATGLEKDITSVADIEKELFENPDVAPKHGDKGYSQLTAVKEARAAASATNTIVEEVDEEVDEETTEDVVEGQDTTNASD